MKIQKPPPPFIAKYVIKLHFFLSRVADKVLPQYYQLMFQSIGAMSSFTIHLAARLNIADHLITGSKDISELVQLTKTDEASLLRFMRALSFLGVFKEKPLGFFSLTSRGRLLCEDNDPSIKPLALLMGREAWFDSWANIEHSIKTGESSFRAMFGKGYFEYQKSNKEERELFDLWMKQGAFANSPAIAWRYPFGRFNKVVDIGGGTGHLIRTILHAHPNVKEGVCFDMPEVIALAEEDNQLGNRYKTIGGDFFDEVPSADLFIMHQIIHDWDDERCMCILRNLHRSLSENGRVLIVEAVLRPGSLDDFYQLLDLQMLILSDGGRERTFEEFSDILDKSGFKLNRCIATGSAFSILEVIKNKDLQIYFRNKNNRSSGAPCRRHNYTGRDAFSFYTPQEWPSSHFHSPQYDRANHKPCH
ncbi:MAG: hypothetical protein MUO76_18855 [Anaerolineaceae bacterium]|nr:hypothetical protein [Anaerolineaceae bacterium]